MKYTHLSFSACGFLGIYHLGAATMLCTRGRGLLRDITGFAGASAGALVATMLLTAPERLEACTRFVFAFAEETRMQALGPVTPGYNFMARLRGGIDSILPQHAHTLAQGRLHVSVTSMADRRSHLVSSFTSRDDLITVLLASCFIPVYAGLEPVEYAGQRWMDGGLTDSLPVLPMGHTLTFSPFSGRADVSPRDPGWPGVCVSFAKQDITISMANLVRAWQMLFPPDCWSLDSPSPQEDFPVPSCFSDCTRRLTLLASCAQQ
ncbi:patatin-like phospholipase domain-containing protein 4 isoform X1 [Apodemus sylvaticus]|uniref:patatin-like phospholipase domain-containing protein 4 isoform X1 n=1 Tax=Apodemus sylvaticus TaxID=10129 RepID=UPI0022447C32|nr:patatin-like phospholipase domain-containing protein 4 isoform X1 [Apodemus sylvaticus]XP_052025557.1 patatin-like phospholipase domain-containing protein 4 isoform X1 [Apodemus sylvaticus]